MPKSRRIEIATMGGLASGQNKEICKMNGRRAGLLVLQRYGLEHFAKLGRVGGKIGGVRGDVTRRRKRDERIRRMQQQEQEEQQYDDEFDELEEEQEQEHHHDVADMQPV